MQKNREYQRLGPKIIHKIFNVGAATADADIKKLIGWSATLRIFGKFMRQIMRYCLI